MNIGFDVAFGGATRSQLYVNNNGNVTFTGPLGMYTAFDVTWDGVGYFSGRYVLRVRNGVVTTPEPASLGLLSFGLAVLGAVAYRRRTATSLTPVGCSRSIESRQHV